MRDLARDFCFLVWVVIKSSLQVISATLDAGSTPSRDVQGH